MKKILFGLGLILGSALFGAVGDIKVQQQSATGAFPDRIFATANNGIWITSGTGAPSIATTLPTAVQDNITRLGTVTSGAVPGSLVTGAYTSSTMTLATSRLLGRTTASSGAVEEISIGTSLSLSGGSLNTIQDIRTSASPTFAGITTSGIGVNTFGTAPATVTIQPTGTIGLALVQTGAVNNYIRITGNNTSQDDAFSVTNGTTTWGAGLLSAGGFTSDYVISTGYTGQVRVSTAGNLTITGAFTKPGGASPIISTNTAITSGAGASAGTLLDAPIAGNPTKWIPINDNGTTRYFPSW